MARPEDLNWSEPPVTARPVRSRDTRMKGRDFTAGTKKPRNRGHPGGTWRSVAEGTVAPVTMANDKGTTVGPWDR